MEQFYVPEFDPHGLNEVENIRGEADEGVGCGTVDNPAMGKNKRKKDVPPEGNRRAAVWQHYTFSMVVGNEGKEEPQATCKYCKKGKYKADPKYGTSNAKKHLANCTAYQSYLAENPSYGSEFDQKVYCKLFAEAIMCHAYPLSIVEHGRLRKLHYYLNPNVRHISRNTILRYCIIEHEKLKHFLCDSMAECNSRISFTCDCWSACTSRGYLTLTAHFIDNNWCLKSRILNFRYFPPPHRGIDIYLFVLGLIKEWKLEGKCFSMTCDNAGAMDVMVTRLKPDLHSFGSLPSNGRFFHVRCCAHILNLIVQSGMHLVDDSVLKLREAVNYINGSDGRLSKFEQCIKDVKSAFVGKLRLDCPTRWNSTYLMLKRAVEARSALDLLAVVDTSFKYNLSLEEWNVVEFICQFLEPFYRVTVMFSGSDYPTANLYFANMVAIEKLLVLGHDHHVHSIRTMASAMFEKYEKYWSEYTVVLSVAVLLDPRFKLRFVKTMLGLLYVPLEVEAKVKDIYEAFLDLYKFYDSGSSSSTSHPLSSCQSNTFSLSNMFEQFEASNSVSEDAVAAVDAYLNAPLVPQNTQNFDILLYWKGNSVMYPALSRMAKDILAIPITSVASESSFSMGGRTLTKYRSSLLPKNVEAFVTTQNWLFGYVSEEDVDESYEVIKESVVDDIDYESLPRVD